MDDIKMLSYAWIAHRSKVLRPLGYGKRGYGTDGGGADVGGADKGIPGGLAVEDLGVADVEEGAEGAIIEEEVILKRAIDKGKGIMLQEANSRRKRKYRPRGNGIVIEDDANPSFTDDGDSDSSSETEIQFGSSVMHRRSESKDRFRTKDVGGYSVAEVGGTSANN
ncbi:hypothetical protein Tco_0709184, partial [Tanacetum coccineum]